MMTFTYNEIDPTNLTSQDLKRVVESNTGWKTYTVSIFNEDGTPHSFPDTCFALHLESQGRLGISWGGDATWADVPDLETGIDIWLNDGESWIALN